MDVSGTGDKIIDLPAHIVSLLHIIGNRGSNYFAVQSYDANNKQLDLIVNTTDPYDGFRLIDVYDANHAARLKVRATGAWSIQVLPFESIRQETLPAKFTGKGDDIIILLGGKPDTARIKGNSATAYFAVKAYRRSGEYDLLVNTTDAYDGEVMLDTDAVILDVKATGPWEIDVTAK